MTLNQDLIFTLLKVETEGAAGLQGQQLIDLLELVGADYVEFAGSKLTLTVKGRHVLAETSGAEAASV